MKNSAPRAGFTLIELLAVILILSILAGVLITNLRDTTQSAKRQATITLMAEIGGAIEHYRVEQGSCPASSFVTAQEVGNDGLNVGIEALVVTLWSKGYEAGGLLTKLRDTLVNTDGDSSSKQLTDFGTRELLELPDSWGNPIAYIERADYGLSNRAYLCLDAESGEPTDSIPTAFKNPRTGQYFQPLAFQLISAGEDGRFGTEDDITTFERQ